MSKELDNILSNIKLSSDVLNNITETEVNKAIKIFTEDSKIGRRSIEYSPNVRDCIRDEVIKRMKKLLESKGFYSVIRTESYYGYKYLVITIDKINKWKRFLYKIGWH